MSETRKRRLDDDDTKTFGCLPRRWTRPGGLFGTLGKRARWPATQATTAAPMEDTEDEEDALLDIEDPEGSRIAAALIRSPTVKRYQVAPSETAATLSTEPTPGLETGPPPPSSAAAEPIQEVEMREDKPPPLTGGGVRRNLFWQELDGLKEENSLLRFESDVQRAKRRVVSIKLEMQEFVTTLLCLTAFGFQSTQVDRAVLSVVTEACRAVSSAVNSILDAPAVLLQYLSCDASDHELDLQEHVRAACACGCGHDRRCVITATSKALQGATGVSMDVAAGGSWRILYERETTDDMNGTYNVRLWLDLLRDKYDAFGRIPKTTATTVVPSTEDLLVHLRLRGSGGRVWSKRLALLTPFFLGNCLYIIGVHLPEDFTPLAKTDPKIQAIEEEIALRRQTAKVLERIAESTGQVLRQALHLLDQHDLSRSFSRPPHPLPTSKVFTIPD